MNTTHRIEWLDAIKGIGIILVMLSHVSSFSPIGIYLFSAFIPLFYISSGIVSKKESLNNTLKSKSKRLLIPYFFYGILGSIFFTLIKNGTTYQGGTVNQWLGLLYSRFCLYPYGTENNLYFLPFESTSPLWFLTSLFTGFILYYFLNKKYKYKYFNYIILVIYIITTLYLADLKVLLPWSMDLAFMTAIFLYIGNILKKYFLYKKTKVLLNISSATIFLLIYIYIIHTNGFINLSVKEYGNEQWNGVFMTFISGTFFFLTIMLLFKSIPSHYYKYLSIVGKYSLRLMCIQMPILLITKKAIKIMHFNNLLETVAICIIFITITFTISYVLQLIFNKYSNKIQILKYL